MDSFEQLRQAQQRQPNDASGKRLGGALGAMLGSLGISLRDVDAFAIKHPNGLFTQDVDMAGLWRNTAAGSVMGKAHEDIKQAAASVRIGTGDAAGFSTGYSRKEGSDGMER
jgi:hypothetical protein